MKVLRILFGATLGLLFTGGLFFLMLSLVESSDYEIENKPSRKLADIYMPERDIEIRVDRKKPEKPQEPDEPPPEMAQPLPDNFDIALDAINIAPVSKFEFNISAGSGFSSSDGEYLPIVKVQPVYPRRAERRGIAGYCIVEYTVTRSGAIANPVPVDCQPQGIFEKNSVSAALKFKYKPRVVDGESIAVAGVRNKFTFLAAE